MKWHKKEDSLKYDEDIVNRYTVVPLGNIDSWFNALYDSISKSLKDDKTEVVIINPNTEICQNLIDFELLNQSVLNNSRFVIVFDENHSIIDVSLYYAKSVVDSDTDFDRDLNQCGIIRMSN